MGRSMEPRHAGSVSLLSETAQNDQCWVPSLGVEQPAACPKSRKENLSW